MTNVKQNVSKNAIVDKIYNVAAVARELKINESQIKTFRSFLRKNEKSLKYNEFRNIKFTNTSNAYKLCANAVDAFKTKNRVVTQ